MKNMSKEIFYRGVLSFLLLSVVILSPLLLVKFFAMFFPLHFDSILNYSILLGVSLTIVSWVVFMLRHHITLKKTLMPMARKMEMGEIAVRVAHDLISPLSSMRNAMMLLEESKSEKQESEETLQLLHLSVNRLQNITDDLLKKQMGEEEEKVHFELHQVLDPLLEEYRAQPIFEAIHFEKQYHREMICLFGIRSRIERAFNNVIKNGIEAMDYRGVMTITARVVHYQMLLEFRDNGPGMGPDLIRKILQGKRATQGKKEGHGIGLKFVCEVIRDHQGRFDIVSIPGEGACFQFFLPIHTASVEAQHLSVVAGGVF